MEKQISIIIPTYNMEKYLARCLDSLLIPELDQVEVLVINDGSKDRSSEIAHSYAERYPNSIRVIDKENGNYGSCINAALPLVTGRYVKVLDADDTFDTAVFSEFVRCLRSINADVIVTPYCIVNSSGKVTKNVPIYKDNMMLSLEEAIDNNIVNASTLMHSLCYNLDIFSRFNYSQSEKVSFSDTEWAAIPLAHANNIQTLNTGNLYRYLVGREGQTMDTSRMKSQISSYREVAKKIIHEYSTLGSECKSPLFLEMHAKRIIAIYYLKVIIHGLREEYSHIKEIDSELKKNHHELYDYLTTIPYIKGWRYFPIKDFRISGYATDYHVPQKPLHLALKDKIVQGCRNIKNLCHH